MKKALVVVAVIVAIVVVGVLAVPVLFSAERVKTELVAKVKEMTGRDLTIGGRFAFSLLPTLGVQAEGLTLANPPGYRSPALLQLRELDAHLKLWPLLMGRFELDGVVLRAPTISLEVDGNGRGNWLLTKAAVARAAETSPLAPAALPPVPASAGKGAGGVKGVSDVRLGDVRIEAGTLTYLGDKGVTETAEGVDFDLIMNSLDEPLTVKGGLIWHGQALAVDMTFARPRALLEGRDSAGSVNLASQSLRLAFAGSFGGASTGTLEVTSPSLRSLAAWVEGRPVASSGLGPFAMKAHVAADAGLLALTDVMLSLDASKATGRLSAALGGARPALKGQLDLETLDLTPYSTPEDKAASNVPAAPSDDQAIIKSHSDWSDDAIDASLLRSVDADVALHAASIRLRQEEVGHSALQVALHDGKLTAVLADTVFFQGKGAGQIALDGTGVGVLADVQFALTDVQAGHLLAAFGIGWLEGEANTEWQLALHGASPRQLVSSLSGKGTLICENGAVRGINLGAAGRNAASGRLPDGQDAPKTAFSDLSGSFSIADGVVTNRDLKLNAPLLRVTGAGSVDLPKRTVQYRIEPTLLANQEGQGKPKGDGGLTVPIIVDGSLDEVHFRPDLESLAKSKAVSGVRDFLKHQTLPKGLPFDPAKLFGQ